MSKTLQYELNQQDMEAFYAHHVAHAPYLVARYRRLRWTSSGIFVLIALAYLPLRSSGTAVFLVLAVVYFVFFYRIHHWSYVRYYRRVNAGPDGPRLGAVKLELTDHDLLVESPEASSRINLSAVRRIDESDSHYYLYLGPSAAIIVPKDAGPVESFVQGIRDSGVVPDNSHQSGHQ